MARKRDDAFHRHRNLDDSLFIEEGNGDWLTYRRLVLAELKYIKFKLDKMDQDYVKKSEFIPIRNFVYGLITIVLTAVVGSILATAFKLTVV